MFGWFRKFGRVPEEKIPQLDRRAFLAGLTVTSAGLLVPRPVMSFAPPPSLADWFEILLRDEQHQVVASMRLDEGAIRLNGKVGLAREVVFPTATKSWGMVSEVIVCDESGVIAEGAVIQPKHVSSGDTVLFQAGDLPFSES